MKKEFLLTAVFLGTFLFFLADDVLSQATVGYIFKKKDASDSVPKITEAACSQGKLTLKFDVPLQFSSTLACSSCTQNRLYASLVMTTTVYYVNPADGTESVQATSKRNVAICPMGNPNPACNNVAWTGTIYDFSSLKEEFSGIDCKNYRAEIKLEDSGKNPQSQFDYCSGVDTCNALDTDPLVTAPPKVGEIKIDSKFVDVYGKIYSDKEVKVSASASNIFGQASCKVCLSADKKVCLSKQDSGWTDADYDVGTSKCSASLQPSEGRFYTNLRIRDATGNMGFGDAQEIFVDKTPPTATIGSLSSLQTRDNWAVKISGSDSKLTDGSDPSGVKIFQLEREINNGQFSLWEQTAFELAFTDCANQVLSQCSVRDGDTVCYRVRGIDKAGNTGDYSAPACTKVDFTCRKANPEVIFLPVSVSSDAMKLQVRVRSTFSPACGASDYEINDITIPTDWDNFIRSQIKINEIPDDKIKQIKNDLNWPFTTSAGLKEELRLAIFGNPDSPSWTKPSLVRLQKVGLFEFSNIPDKKIFDTVLQQIESGETKTFYVSIPLQSNIIPRFYTLGVTAVSQNEFVQTAKTTYAPGQEDFSISVDKDSQTILSGNEVSFKVTLSSLRGFSRSVDLSFIGCPKDATCSLDKNKVDLKSSESSTANFKVKTSSSTPSKNYAVTVIGLSGFTQDSSEVFLRRGADLQVNVRTGTETFVPYAKGAEISLKAGWNLIAPAFDSLKTHNCQFRGSIYGYSTSKQDYEVVALDQIEGGFGYWVMATSACKMTFDEIKPVQQIQLSKGWNIIGSVNNREISLSEIKNKCNLKASQYVYDPDVSDYKVVDKLFPNHGHWILLDAPCTLS